MSANIQGLNQKFKLGARNFIVNAQNKWTDFAQKRNGEGLNLLVKVKLVFY